MPATTTAPTATYVHIPCTYSAHFLTRLQKNKSKKWGGSQSPKHINICVTCTSAVDGKKSFVKADTAPHVVIIVAATKPNRSLCFSMWSIQYDHALRAPGTSPKPPYMLNILQNSYSCIYHSHESTQLGKFQLQANLHNALEITSVKFVWLRYRWRKIISKKIIFIWFLFKLDRRVSLILRFFTEFHRFSGRLYHSGWR